MEEQYREIIKRLDELSLDLRGDERRGHRGVRGRLDVLEETTRMLEHQSLYQDRRIAAFSGLMGAIGAAVGFVGALLSGLVSSLFS